MGQAQSLCELVERAMSVRRRPRGRMAIGVVVAVLIVLAFTAGAAAASTDSAGSYLPINGPMIAGPALGWTQYRSDGSYALRVHAADGGVKTAYSQTPGRGEQIRVALAGGPPGFLLQQTTGPQSPSPAGPRDTASVFVPLAGSASRIGSCMPDACGLPSVDISGSFAVHYGPGADTVSVQDLTGAGPPVSITGVGLRPRIAGRYLSLEIYNGVVVYDWRARREVYRISALVQAHARAVDIQDDGKIVLVYGVQERGRPYERVGWASPQQPYLHATALRRLPSYAAEIENDQIYFVRKTERNVLARGELGRVSLAGGASILVRGVSSAAEDLDEPDEQFDVAGDRVAWLDRSCRGFGVGSGSISGLAARPLAIGHAHCRLRVRGRTSVVRGRLRGFYDCVGLERGCGLEDVAFRAWLPGGRKGPLLGPLSFEGGNRISAKLSARGRRYLRRPGAQRVVIQARVRVTGGHESRSRTVRVR